MAPSAINDGARALEGLLARWNKDIDGSLVSGGTSTAYTLAANQTLSAYYDGLTLVWEANAACGAAPTLNVDAVGAQAIVWPDGSVLGVDDIPANAKITTRYDNDNTRWLLTSTTRRHGVITGTEQATTSGTEKTFVIPPGVKRLVVMVDRLSTNGTSEPAIRLGDAGGVESTGYVGSVADLLTASQNADSLSTGFKMLTTGAAAAVISGQLICSLEDVTNHQWICTGLFARSDTAQMSVVSGSKNLTTALTQVEVNGGGDTLDAGACNVMYE